MPSIGIGARVIWQNILFANFVALCTRFGSAFGPNALNWSVTPYL